MLRAFLLQIRRIFSIRLMIVTAGIIVMNLISITGSLKYQSLSVWYLMEQSLQTGINFFTIHMFPAMVFSDTMAREWESRAARYYIIRSGNNKYIAGKIVSSALGGFLSVFLGMIIQALLLAVKFPFSGDVETGLGSYTQALLQKRFPAVLLGFSFDMGCSGAVSAVIGLTASAYVLNPITAFASPIMLITVISKLASYLRLPEMFDPLVWMRPYIEAESVLESCIKKMSLCLLIMMILSGMTIMRMKRRMENE